MSFNAPLFPEFDGKSQPLFDMTHSLTWLESSLETYLQPDLFIQESTSTSPFSMQPVATHSSYPAFSISDSSTSSVQVSPLPPPSMDYTDPPAQSKNDSTVTLKRQRNTVAARKYRQKRIDRITELEGEVDSLKAEREELRIKLARQEAETAALKEMLRSKG